MGLQEGLEDEDDDADIKSEKEAEKMKFVKKEVCVFVEI